MFKILLSLLTKEHPVYGIVKDDYSRRQRILWIKAGELKVDYQVQTESVKDYLKRIAKIEECELEDVYNIQVEPYHTYFANEIFVQDSTLPVHH